MTGNIIKRTSAVILEKVVTVLKAFFFFMKKLYQI
jgi:hypothetical protein